MRFAQKRCPHGVKIVQIVSFFGFFLIILRIYSFVWNKIIIFAEVSAYCAEVKNVLNTKKTE